MALQKPEFLTFEELAEKWGYSKAYLHDLIRSGRIIPAVALTDQERYPGGEFRGGSFVGDIDTAKHRSYAEYYVGNLVGEENHPENWPQCARTIFCRHPSDDEDSGYSFQFFTETLHPENLEKWFYFDRGRQITGKDGEHRFRFLWEEIERFEDKNSVNECSPENEVTGIEEISSQVVPVDQTPSAVNEEQAIVHRTIQKRKHILDAEIKIARERATDPNDIHGVWSELAKLAQAKEGCLLGLGNDNEIKYGTGEDVKVFMKKNLGDRLRRAKRR